MSHGRYAPPPPAVPGTAATGPTIPVLVSALGILAASIGLLGALFALGLRVRDAAGPPELIPLGLVEVLPPPRMGVSEASDAQGPALVVLIDPACPACGRAETELADDPTFDERALAVHWIDHDRVPPPVARRIGKGRLPMFLLFDVEGKLVARTHGYRSREDLLDRIRTLDGPPPRPASSEEDGVLSLDPSPSAGGP